MGENNKQKNFMAKDLLRDLTQEEVARLAHDVFGNITKITVAKTFDNDGTTFDINYVMNENPNRINSTLLSGKPLRLTKFGFADEGMLIPEGMLQVFNLLATSVEPQDLEAFKENFLTQVNDTFYGQILQSANNQGQEPENAQQISKECDESLYYLSQFMNSLQEQLGLIGNVPNGSEKTNI